MSCSPASPASCKLKRQVVSRTGSQRSSPTTNGSSPSSRIDWSRSALRRHLRKPVFDGERDQLRRALDVEFPQNIAAVRLDGTRRNGQPLPHFLIAQTLSDQRQNRPLPFGKDFD